DLLLAEFSRDHGDRAVDVDRNLELTRDHVARSHGNDGERNRRAAQAREYARNGSVAATRDDEIEIVAAFVHQLLALLLLSDLEDLVLDPRGLELAVQCVLDGLVVALALTEYDERFH